MCGEPNPYVYEDTIPLKIMKEWEMYETQQGYRDDLHWGLLISVLRNIHRNKNEPASRITDNMPYLVDAEPDPDDIHESIQRRLRQAKQRQINITRGNRSKS